MLEIEPYMLPLVNHNGEPARLDTSVQRLADHLENSLSISEHLENKQGPPTLSPTLIDHHQIESNVSQRHHLNLTHGTTSTMHAPPTLQTSLQPLHHHDDNNNNNNNNSSLRLLTQNDIPPSSLLSSQLALFEQSTPDDQQKLIMLWRLAPPTYARNGGQELADRVGEYQSVSLEQEEELTWRRYQRNFAFMANVKDTVQAERLCGKQSLLGEYLDDSTSSTGGGGDSGGWLAGRDEDGDGDEEML